MLFRYNGRSYEVWQLPLNILEPLIKSVEHNLKNIIVDVKLAEHIYQGVIDAESFRLWKLRHKRELRMLKREYELRCDDTYRALAVQLQETPNDATTTLILADRCNDLGEPWREKKLRALAKLLVEKK